MRKFKLAGSTLQVQTVLPADCCTFILSTFFTGRYDVIIQTYRFFLGDCRFFLFQQAAAQYSVNVPYNEVSVENQEGIATFHGPDGVGFATIPGEPRLPFEIVSILLPPGVDFKDVTVQLVNPFYEVPGGTFNVDPLPGSWPDSTKIVDGKDT